MGFGKKGCKVERMSSQNIKIYLPLLSLIKWIINGPHLGFIFCRYLDALSFFFSSFLLFEN